MVSTLSVQFSQWLERFLETARPGAALPVDRELAKTFSLSLSSIRRILTRYRDQGRILRIPGKGTFAAGLPAPGDPEPNRATADDLALEFRRLISRGEIKNGEPLPPVKTVCLQYRVGPSSVTSAYRRLCADDLAHRIGRRYWAGPFSPISGTGSRRPVWFFYDKLNSMDIVQSRYGEYFAYLKMERELLAYGFHPYYRPLEELKKKEAGWSDSRDYPAGVVLIVERDDNLRPYTDALARLHALAGPGTAILVLARNLVPSLPGTDVMLIRQHSGGMVYRTLAGFLVNKGYTSAALFYDQTIPNPKTFGNMVRFWPEAKHLLPAFQVRYFVVPAPQYRGFDAFIDHFIYDPAVSNTRVNLEKYEPSGAAGIRAGIILVDRMEAMFKQAQAYPVWVFGRAGQADRAVTRLEQDGKKVPEDVLVVSLENDPAYLHKTITTCTEDWETIGYVMAHAIIRDLPLARTSRGHLRTAAILKDYSV